MQRPWLLAAAVLVTLTAVAALAVRATSPEARDRRAIRDHVAEMQSALRRHDLRMWLHVTTGHPVAPGDASLAAIHDRMLRDFERLQHLPGLAMTDIEVEITGDTAIARYRIEAAPPERGSPPAPDGGEVTLVRGTKGWEMTDHRLIEAR